MATAAMPRMAGDLKLEYGRGEVFALKFITGKNVPSRYPGGRVMFTIADTGEGERKLFLDDEDGSDLERTVREMGIQPGEPILVTKVKLAHGGGHAIRVARVSDAAELPARYQEAATSDRRLEAQLEKSIEMARNGGRGAFSTNAPTGQVNYTNNNGRSNDTPAPRALSGTVITPASAKLCAAFMSAIDAVVEARAYAERRGLQIEFSAEDVRSTAISCYITACREGGR